MKRIGQQQRSAQDERNQVVMIQLRIKNENDLYDPYDPSQIRINEGVYQYLKSYCSGLESSEHIYDTLQIVTDSAIDTEKFQTALHDAVKRDIAEFDWKIARNNRRTIWELVIGVLLSVLGIVLAVILDKVLLAIISFLGSMCLRDSVTIQTTHNHDIKRLKKLISPIYNIKLELIRPDP